MKLVSAGVRGYARFRDANEVRLDNKVVAIVGPNEAGKTSFLRALTRLNNDDPLSAEGESRELSRGAAETHLPVIWALYLIEDADKVAIKADESSSKARWLLVEKASDGPLIKRLIPHIPRDLVPRTEIVQELTRFLASPPVRSRLSIAWDDDPGRIVLDTVRQLPGALKTDSESLPKATVQLARDRRLAACTTTQEMASHPSSPAQVA